MATAGFGLVGGPDTEDRSRGMGRRTGSQQHGPSSISMRRLLFLALLLALLRPCPAPPINPGAQNEELKLPIVRDTIKVSSARSTYQLHGWIDRSDRSVDLIGGSTGRPDRGRLAGAFHSMTHDAAKNSREIPPRAPALTNHIYI